MECQTQITLTGQKIKLYHKWLYKPYFIDDKIKGEKKEIFREICKVCGKVNHIKHK